MHALEAIVGVEMDLITLITTQTAATVIMGWRQKNIDVRSEV